MIAESICDLIFMQSNDSERNKVKSRPRRPSRLQRRGEFHISVLLSPENHPTRILRLKKKDIALMQFILEGYEGLCSVSTMDPRVAILCVSSMPGFEAEVGEILAGLRTDFEFEEGF